MTIMKSGFRNSFETHPGLSVPLRSIWLKAAMIIKTQGGPAQSLSCFSPLAAFAICPLYALRATGRKSVKAGVRSIWCTIIASKLIMFFLL